MADQQTPTERETLTALRGLAKWLRTPGNVYTPDAVDECARALENLANSLEAKFAALAASPAPEGETPHVSMDTLTGVTVAGARAFWALQDLETRHERLRVAILSAVSAPELGHPNPTWEAIRADLTAAFNADTSAPASPEPTADGRETCEWTDDPSGWQTGCGREWQFIDDGPIENRIDYCMGCGRKVALTGGTQETTE